MQRNKIYASRLFALIAMILTLSPIAAQAAVVGTTTRIPLILSQSMSCINGQPQVALTWNNPNSAKSFVLHRNPTIAGVARWAILTQGGNTLLSFQDSKVSTTGTYQYQIQAIDSAGGSRYSDPVSVYIKSCQPAAQTPPITPPPPPPTTTPIVNTPPVTITPTPQPTSPITTVTPKKLKWGAYSGWSNADMSEFETKIVKNPDHMASFVHWGNSNAFPTYMTPYTKDKGRTLIIFWEPSDHTIGGTVQPAFSYDAILRGDWDAYIRSFAEQARV